MTKGQNKTEIFDVKALLERDEDFLRSAVEALVQAVLEAEMSQAIGAEKGERTAGRLAYCSGYYGRSLITRVGTLELRVPQDRPGRFLAALVPNRVDRLFFAGDLGQRIYQQPFSWKSLGIS